MVMSGAERDALVMADAVVRKAGGGGIHVAGFDVLEGVVLYNGEAVTVMTFEPRVEPKVEPKPEAPKGK